MIKAKLFGDWEKARTILNNVEGVRKAIDSAVLAEAHYARREIVKGITKQSPGGKDFLPLGKLTLLLRRARGFRGTKALIVTATLRNSITVQPAGRGRAFVGVLRTTQRPDGKELFNIARVHEMGATIVIRVTPRMRAWLMATLREANGNRMGGMVGQRGRDNQSGRFTAAPRWKPSGGRGGIARGVLVIRVPARPYIQPVIEKIYSDPAAVRQRFAMRISQRLKLTLGKP